MRHRHGYTLIEVILVVVILVLVAALSVPVIQTMLEDGRMTGAGDMVRAKMAEARASAMQSGRPWRLAYIPNTGVFQLAPDDSSDWDNMEQTPIEQAELIRDELPKDVVFAINSSDIVGSQERLTPGTAWQTIAVYKFDGSANDDSTTYFGKMGMMPMAAELRGLTGSVTMRSPVEVKASLP